MAASFRAALVQATPVLGDVKANVASVLDALQRVDADLVVFPELFLSGYQMRDGLKHCAVAPGDESMRALEAACRDTGKHLVVGAPRPGLARGTLHNALFLVGPRGLVGHYDKTHLPTFGVFEEDHFFKEGQALPVFDTPLGRFGLTICYDLFFPEVTKALALAGADVLVCASASPAPSRRYFESVFPARAVETTSWLLYTNIAGPQDTLHFWGGAQAWSPRGDLRAKGPTDVPAVTTVTVDVAEVEEMRGKRPTLRDTRPEIVRRLLENASG